MQLFTLFFYFCITIDKNIMIIIIMETTINVNFKAYVNFDKDITCILFYKYCMCCCPIIIRVLCRDKTLILIEEQHLQN